MAETGATLFDVTTPPELAGAAFEGRVREQARALKAELIRQNLADADSWARSVEDKWANENPDKAPIFAISDEERARYRDRVENSDHEWIIPSFEQLITPDPDQFNPIIDVLSQVEASFGGRPDSTGKWVGADPNLGRLHDVRTDMDEWAGAFKNSFIDRFLTPFQSTLPNHSLLARSVGDQMRLMKVTYIRQRKSTLELLDNAIAATKALSNRSTSGADAVKWATIMLVVSGTLLAAYGTGVGVVATAACLEVAGTVGQGLLPEPKEKQKLPLSAPTATEVAQNVVQALNRLTSDVHETEQIAVGALRELHRVAERERLTALRSNTPGAFLVPAPPLADATPAQLDAGFFPDE
ncbi:hypothetical protein [Actinoplanes utahensis]|uniref:Uncharacterized protein n=1 Tax=Actinoplanes utahensis TaxID=1869 RepID=A0A0A6URC5_ACTUT|nr:hypothetical protein [Actinoplanes utahensis]KHD77986.1 hypothetical protein MB27_07680 [Actinoplanes utahensis]GIF29972.1 hypothetical protein Aut01nite_29580 [Actinoplanes utahensis]